MKYILFAIIGLALTLNGMAQEKKTKRSKKGQKQETAATMNEPAMTNALDSFSYALGLSMAGFYKEQGVENINTTLVTKALNDSKAGKPLLDENQINDAIISFMQSAKGKKAEPNKMTGQAFLDSNKTKPGVVTRPSGLQYKVITARIGRKPSVDDKVRVHYHGMLLDGKVFDSSVERGEPIELNVNEVIPGWTEALQLMPVGSKWQLYIPSDLAYGDAGAGTDIPPGSTLIFDVELLDIVK